MRTVSLMLGPALIALVTSGSAAASEGRLGARQAVVESLRHQEVLVKSAKAEFTVTASATPPASVADIREVCRNRGMEDDHVNFVITPQFAQATSYAVRWQRKGRKELTERFAIGAPRSASPITMTGFDGEFIRAVNHDRRVGFFDSVQSAAWDASSRVEPFSFFYEFMTMPMSTLVESAGEFSVGTSRRSGRDLTEVTVAHPRFDRIVLRFDEHDRVVERDAFALGYSADPKESLMYERYEFDLYQAHTDRSGEKIWFPKRTKRHRFVGKLPDGRMVRYGTETIDIVHIEFNVEIPDDAFLVEFPAQWRVWDNVNGLGWTGGPQTIDAAKDGRSPWNLVVFALLPILGIAVILIRRRRKRGSLGSP